MNETTGHIPTPAESAHSRLQEFPDDPFAAAVEAGKERRMDEMDAWAKGMGAHVERRQEAHRKVVKNLIDSARTTGQIPDPEDTQRRLRESVTNWRTGVKVTPEGDVEIHDHYPYYGDTPAGGWSKYRSPQNIRK